MTRTPELAGKTQDAKIRAPKHSREGELSSCGWEEGVREQGSSWAKPGS